MVRVVKFFSLEFACEKFLEVDATTQQKLFSINDESISDLFISLYYVLISGQSSLIKVCNYGRPKVSPRLRED